jgi:hypothetical protein
MCGVGCALPQEQGVLKVGFSLFIAFQLGEQAGKTDPGCDDVRVSRPEYLLLDRQRVFIVRLCLAIPTLERAEVRQIEQRARQLRSHGGRMEVG